MARGFESKDVEFQQAEADRIKEARSAFGRGLTAEERAAREQRRTLELALARARAERGAARSPAHQQMLDAAVADLEAALRRLSPSAAAS